MRVGLKGRDLNDPHISVVKKGVAPSSQSHAHFLRFCIHVCAEPLSRDDQISPLHSDVCFEMCSLILRRRFRDALIFWQYGVTTECGSFTHTPRVFARGRRFVLRVPSSLGFCFWT